MKVLINQGEIASLDLNASKAGEPCRPAIETCGYHIEGPEVLMNLEQSGDGLALNLDLPGVATMTVLVEQTDVKQLKGLMNKDAIKFMIKALM